MDSLSIDKYYKYLDNKHNHILGRDKDPMLATDLSKFQLWIRKTSWTILTFPGLRLLTKFIYPSSTISHLKVKNAVAFTIDDGFCGYDNNEGCMITEVKELFKSYNATATFFISGSHCEHVQTDEINSLIDDGHEIANHNMKDWPYKNYSTNEFKFDLELTEKKLNIFKKINKKWYRAPFGQLSKNMQEIIDQKNMIHVVPDVFANDTFIPDPKWIAKYILKRVKSGSIILIHMPEKGVREWNFEAMELTLIGLQEKGLKVLNLSQMTNEIK